MSTTQSDRAAVNESTFREINEQLDAMRPHEGRSNYLCECWRATCSEHLALTAAEYEHVRSNPTWFATAPGHTNPDVEVVVERHPRHWVVQKIGEAATVSRLTDPRD